MTNQVNENGARHIAQVLTDLREELKDFANTRFQMLRSELAEKVQSWKAGIPMLLVAVVLLGTAWLLLTAGLVMLVTMLLPSSPWSALAAVSLVLVAYGIAGFVMGMIGWRNLTRQSVAPNRTLRVLKQDQLWFQAEARTQV